MCFLRVVVFIIIKVEFKERELIKEDNDDHENKDKSVDIVEDFSPLDDSMELKCVVHYLCSTGQVHPILSEILRGLRKG